MNQEAHQAYAFGDYVVNVANRELLVNVWGPEYENEVKYLSVYIRYLRRKIEDDPSETWVYGPWETSCFIIRPGDR